VNGKHFKDKQKKEYRVNNVLTRQSLGMGTNTRANRSKNNVTVNTRVQQNATGWKFIKRAPMRRPTLAEAKKKEVSVNFAINKITKDNLSTKRDDHKAQKRKKMCGAKLNMPSGATAQRVKKAKKKFEESQSYNDWRRR
jgi:hypothetical protein